MRFDFANVLLSGPCNLRCPHCIGHVLPAAPGGSTLDAFPLPGLERFAAMLRENGVREVSLTGTNTEPLLYRHHERLVASLREAVPGVRVSLHTNGVLALARMDVLRLFDRGTVSFPSFEEATYARLTGGARPYDLAALLAASPIALKVSVLLTDETLPQVPQTLERLAGIGARRVVLRRLYGEARPMDPLAGRRPDRLFAGNPVYRLGALEVTVWDFARARLRCLNLFPDGSITEEYELARSRLAA